MMSSRCRFSYIWGDRTGLTSPSPSPCMHACCYPVNNSWGPPPYFIAKKWMFHVWRKGGFAERRSATGERAGTGDREGKERHFWFLDTWPTQHRWKNKGGIRGCRASHKHRALANECTAAVAPPPQGAALLTDRAWLRVVIESNDN